MYCSKCGRETDAEGKFCQWCGADLTATPPRPVIRRRRGILTENYAGIGRRFVAFIVDLLFILFIDLVLTGLFGLSEGFRMINQRLHHLPYTDQSGQVVNALVPIPVILSVGILVILVPWLYYAILECSKNQATLGKIALRIAVTDLHGDRITFSRATLRFYAKILVLITFFVGFIIVAFSRQKQGLHDIVAGCLMFIQ
jgi:uncharacterized RDD family membrane protein YckC